MTIYDRLCNDCVYYYRYLVLLHYSPREEVVQLKEIEEGSSNRDRARPHTQIKEQIQC